MIYAIRHLQISMLKKYIVKNRGKTNVEALVPLFDTTKRLLVKYENELPKISNQKYNAYLKEIQILCNIPVVLTSHLARRTFAYLMLNVHGVPYETVSKLLGHADLQTAQKYYVNIGLDKILKDLENIK
jgi:site-specific recombinase XerD